MLLFRSGFPGVPTRPARKTESQIAQRMRCAKRLAETASVAHSLL